MAIRGRPLALTPFQEGANGLGHAFVAPLHLVQRRQLAAQGAAGFLLPDSFFAVLPHVALQHLDLLPLGLQIRLQIRQDLFDVVESDRVLGFFGQRRLQFGPGGLDPRDQAFLLIR